MATAVIEVRRMARPLDPDVTSLLRRAATLLRQDRHFQIADELETAAQEADARPIAIHSAGDPTLERTIDQVLTVAAVRMALDGCADYHRHRPLLFTSNARQRMLERMLVRQVLLAVSIPTQ